MATATAEEVMSPGLLMTGLAEATAAAEALITIRTNTANSYISTSEIYKK